MRPPSLLRSLPTLRQVAERWLFRHHGVENGEVFLGQRRIFIMPSRAGVAYALMLMVLFIGSVNYNLSMGFSLTFLLGACAVIDMHLTFRNLAHLYLAPGRGSPVYAGDDASFELHLANRRRHGRHAIGIGFMAPAANNAGSREDRPIVQMVDIDALSQRSVTLNAPALQRGWLQAPRVRLSTSFPLGLLSAWSYWHPDLRVLVYPRPAEDFRPLPFASSTGAPGDGTSQSGDEEFAGIRPYQAGDSPRRLAWRQIARLDALADGTLVSKHFEGGVATELQLDFSTLPAGWGIEERLSCMTRWVIEAEARALPYAFVLEHIRYAPALGAAHQDACLRALALFGVVR
ncbi:MAG: DUF58 domain-containing protein [Janthinobacterium lividum]